MTFLNQLMLLGLAGISIPILVHLFNRRRAKVVEWGAMQFLLGSVVNRRRRVLMEELILMVIRCLLVAVVVLMIARPFAPVGASLAWGLLLPGLLAAALLGAMGAIIAKTTLMRSLAFGGAILLAVVLVGMSSMQNRWYSSIWGGGSAQDIVVILDGSSSMNAKVEGRSNFERAVDEFRQLLAGLPPDADVSLLVSGATTRLVTPVPLDVRSNWTEVLENLQTQGGIFDPIEAFSTAAAVLTRGNQATQRIVLISDGQATSWRDDDPQPWSLLQAQFSNLKTQPKVVSRFLPLPAGFQNVSVAGITLSRDLVGAGHLTTIRIRIENTGATTVASSGLQLQYDRGTSESLEVPELPPGESVQLEVPHQFDEAGSHVLTVKWLGQDDLPDDDVRSHVVAVKDRMPVLLIDGANANRFLDQATSFVQTALAPIAESEASTGAGAQSDAAPFVLVTTHPAADLPADLDWDAYEVVVLCDVPRLGATHAKALEEFVSRGGGLIIAPGGRAEPQFYAQWKSADGRALVPAELTQFVVTQGDDVPSRPAVDSFEHPALQRMVSSASSDLRQVDIQAHWKLKVLEGSQVKVDARLDLGDAWIVEQPFGRGRVILLSTSLDDRASTLPSSISYVPLVHELTYTAAKSASIRLNRDPASVITFELPVQSDLITAAQATSDPANSPMPAATGETSTDPGAEGKQAGEGDAEAAVLTRITPVTTPRQDTTQARWELRNQHAVVSLTGVSQPGIYEIEIPAIFASQVPARVSAETTESGSKRLPLSVVLDPQETNLEPLSESQEGLMSKDFDYLRAADFEQLLAAVTGDIPGEELWKVMALAAVILVLAETFATRWIARRRKLGETQTVAFVSEGERLSTFKDRAQDFLKTIPS